MGAQRYGISLSLQLFMQLDISVVSAAHVIGYLKHMYSYCNLSRVEIRYFSEVEIPIKHSSLYNKINTHPVNELFNYNALVFDMG